MTRAATLFLAGAAGLVLLAVVTGFALIPSPSQQRIFNIDARRVQALNALGWAISSFTSSNGRLPNSLDELTQANEQARSNAADVETGRPYEYVKGDPVKGEDFRYQLCATFTAPTQRGAYTDFRHPAGRHCMSKSAPKSKS